MRIRTRLFVQGALLPAGSLIALVLVGGLLLRAALERAVDESLAAQAAVEAISLFDLAEAPHLHLSASPLLEQVRAFVPARAVYNPRGERVLEVAGTSPLPEHVEPPSRDDLGRTRLDTLEVEGEPVRELRLVVRSPMGDLYTLLLRSGLGRVRHTLAAYFRVLGIGALAVSAGFLVIQARASKWWSDRIHNMIRHMRRLEAGDLSSRPAPDDEKDEIGELVLAIDRASERLEAARRAQDRLVADAAHELRTPLAAMRAEIDVTLRRPRDPAVLRETLEVVREEVGRLDALTTRLLDLARLARGAWDFRVADLRALVDASAEAHRAMAEGQRAAIEIAGPARLEARLDPDALRQALDNLLDNALRFSPREGTVRVSIAQDGEHWRVEVADEGPGIPPEEREGIFEPFRRRDPRRGGSGLGLAIVRDVARGHRGRAYVASSARGATVVLEAPLR